MGGRQQTFADFSFTPQPDAEYVIEYLDNPIEAAVNYFVVDRAGSRSALVTKVSNCP